MTDDTRERTVRDDSPDPGADTISTAAIAGADGPTRENLVRADDETDAGAGEPGPNEPPADKRRFDERTVAERTAEGSAVAERTPDHADADTRTHEDGDGDEPAPLFSEDASGRYRERWRAVQTDFVDDPRRAVKQADELVAELMQALARTFADERAALEGQWDTGGDVSTEELRVALQRYRSFFSRLLAF